MQQTDFTAMEDEALVKAAIDTRLGLGRAKAIDELATRAITRPELMAAACAAIASDKKLGFHSGPPLGWLGADRIFLAGQASALAGLLREMDRWDATEQEDLVRHWAGKKGLAALSAELSEKFGWSPKYKVSV